MGKIIVGCLMCVGGLILGLYVGLWVCFIGGIVDVIGEIRADHLVAMNVAIGIAKVLLASFFGWVSAMVLALPGYVMLMMGLEE